MENEDVLEKLKFMKLIKKNLDAFRTFNHIDLTWFTKYSNIGLLFKQSCIYFLKTSECYESKCKRHNVNPNDIYSVTVEVDSNGNPYISVVGADGMNKIAIVSADIQLSNEVVGIKVPEIQFVNEMKFREKQYLKHLAVSPKYLKDEDEIKDVIEEFNEQGQYLIEYVKYLNQVYAGNVSEINLVEENEIKRTLNNKN